MSCLKSYKCKHCKGKGETEGYTKLYETKSNVVWQKTKLCLHCLGTGEFNWIENIVGKNRNDAGHLVQIHHSTIWDFEEEE